MDEQTMKDYLLEVAERIRVETGQRPVSVSYEAFTDATAKRPWKVKVNNPCGYDWAFGSTIDELIKDTITKFGPQMQARRVAKIKDEIAERRQLLANLGVEA